MIGIAGAPGSGKSTLAAALAARVPGAAVLPMDGFHLSLAQLDALPDPVAARAARGAPWTFDPKSFVATVAAAAAGDDVDAPTFDHAARDPVRGGLTLRARDDVVLVEGNYLLLGECFRIFCPCLAP